MEYKNLIIAVSNFAKFVVNYSHFDKKNINQIISSINGWRISYDKKKVISHKIGEVCVIDFGLSYQPEIAFEHRGSY